MRVLVFTFLMMMVTFASAQPAPDWFCLSEKEPNYYAITLLKPDLAHVRAYRFGEDPEIGDYAVRVSHDEERVELLDENGERRFHLEFVEPSVRLVDSARPDDLSIICRVGRDAL